MAGLKRFRIVGILVVVLLTLIPLSATIYTDWAWFQQISKGSVYVKTLMIQLILGFGSFGLAAVLLWVVGWLAFKGRPDDLEFLAVDSPIHTYRKMIEKSFWRFQIVVPLVVGILAGIIGRNSWRTVVMALGSNSFDAQDPQFGVDYSFYAFQLPVISLALSALSMLLIISFIYSLATFYLLGGIKVANATMGRKASICGAARVQLMVIAGIWMLVKVAQLWLDRYELIVADHPGFAGAGYTDIHAVMAAKLVLIVIGLVVAASFFSAIVLKDMRIPVLGTVLMVLSSIAIGTIYPLVVERFTVVPNRIELEAEYINRNIEGTRYAFGLQDVDYQEWSGSADAAAVAADTATISNIRLLDPDVLARTFTQQQQLKNFYGFSKTLNMDRYEVDGQLRDFVVAARELNPATLSENQQDWINRHTVFTHGNGFVAAQANKVDEAARDVGSTRGGYPVYTVEDLQNPGDVTQPRIYFGPIIGGVEPNQDYAIVGGDPVEYDSDTQTFSYDGQGGVSIGNLVSRAAFALRYQELNLLLSQRITADSKIVYNRNPLTRVAQVAPWLTTDSTTYPAVIDGRIKWIVDGYTTLTAFPYAQRAELGDVEDPLGQRKFGYIRNSVKAVVDAYDGTVDLYQVADDPVLNAWKKFYPGIVKTEVPAEIQAHFRYPIDLFETQRTLIAKYHVSDPRSFYANDSMWSVPADMSYSGADEGNAPDQRPNYVVAANPQTGKPEFQLTSAFRGLKREFLAAHMSVSSDPETYGKITVRVLPTTTQTLGPKQVQDTMMSSDRVAQDRTLWEGTNTITTGNLLTLPVGNGQVLYVEPLYTQRKNQDSAFPKLLRVLVFYNNKVGYAPTIAEALAQVGIDPQAAPDLDQAVEMNAAPPAVADAAAATPAPAATTNTPTDLTGVKQALQAVQDAKGGSFEQYGRALDQLQKAIADYEQQGAAATAPAAS